MTLLCVYSEFATTITPLGRAMACFPVSARYSKMISVAEQHDLLPYVIAIVAALSVPELLIKVERLPDGEQVVSRSVHVIILPVFALLLSF